MKLIYATCCREMIHLAYENTLYACGCGNAKAERMEGHEAKYSGNAVPVHIDDASFDKAVSRQHPNMTQSFKACVDPKRSTTFRRVEQL